MKKHLVRFMSLFMLMAILCSLPVNTYAANKKMSLQWKTTKRTVEAGKKLTLKVKIRNKKKGSKLVWTSSSKKIATVTKQGVVSGKKAGKAKITVKIRGTKIKRSCTIQVVKPSAKPTPTPKQTTAPSPAVKPSAKPSAEPSVKPSGTPVASTVPTYVPADDELIPYSGVMEIQGETMTVYLVNKNYAGQVHVRMNGKEFTAEGNAKKALTLLATAGTTKENSAGTIRLSRTTDENGDLGEYWTVEDLELGLSYQMKAETKNTINPTIANCGVIYFRGDVTSAIELY